MATNNAIELKDQGTAYVSTTGAFEGVDASTAGFVLTSNGTNTKPTFQAASSGSGEILSAKVTLTSAQIKSLLATPIELIAAPGADKVIMPISVYYYFVYGGTDAFTNGQIIAPLTNNAGTTTNIVEFTFPAASVIATTSAFQSSSLRSSATVLTTAPTNMINRNVIIKNTGATEITGNAANNNTLEVAMTYYVWTL